MADSPEYPDLKWVPPKSWTNTNRTSVQLVVIHTTEGSAHGQSAEDGAAYDARRTDGTSTHYFHDSNSTIQCVRTNDQAHTARRQGNRRGIQHELCTRAYRGIWSDAYHQALLRQAARQCARDALKWDIPIRKLTAAQVRDGVRGFCGHVEITRAFPEDGGTHTDPGPNFPWVKFLDLVSTELKKLEPQKEPSMPSDQEDLKEKLALKPFSTGGGNGSTVGNSVWGHGIPPVAGEQRTEAYKVLQQINTKANSLQTAANAQASMLAEQREKLDALAAEVAEVRAKIDRVLELLAPDSPPVS